MHSACIIASDRQIIFDNKHHASLCLVVNGMITSGVKSGYKGKKQKKFESCSPVQ